MQSVQQLLINNQFLSCDDNSRNDGVSSISDAQTSSESNGNVDTETESEGIDNVDAETGSEDHDATLPCGEENCFNIENISVHDEFKVCMIICNFIPMRFMCIFVFIFIITC